MEGAVFSVGNPLLDVSANVSQELLDKYGLKIPNAILAEESHLPIYEELINNHQVEYSAGGAAQNTARAVTWMTKIPNLATYVGCIGEDEYGKTLETVAREGHVNVQYLKDPTAPTGTCAALIVNHDRSLVANLGAANNYKSSHFESEPIQAALKKSKAVYSTGFFLTVSPETLIAMGEHAASENKPFVFNLAAPFVIDFFTDKLKSVLPYTDYIFSNESEAAAFGKKFFNTEDLQETAKLLSKYEKKNTKRERVVVFTQGPNPTIVAIGDNVTTYGVIPLSESEIVDANGAGDCFTGGFLGGLILDKDIARCIDGANYCANYILKRGGIKFDTPCTFEY